MFRLICTKLMIRASLVILLLSVMICDLCYAGSFIFNDGHFMYKNESGNFAYNTWVWIDENSDGIAELYRFDENGFVSPNYIHYDGKKTNEHGQLVVNGVVISKLVTTNKILVSESKPPSNICATSSNIILTYDLKKESYNLISDNKGMPNEVNNDGRVINLSRDVSASPNGSKINNEVIYNQVDDDKISLNAKGELIPGVNAKKFITSSYKFNKNVSDVKVFNADIWEDCMEFDGNNSKVKFSLNKFNHIYFEVSNAYREKGKYDTELDAVIVVYADNKLIDEIESFSDSGPEEVDIDLEGYKTVELKVSILEGNTQEKIYIRNVKLRKIKDDE